MVGGKLFDANYRRQWLDSLEPQDPGKPLGQKYGYGISQITFGPNSVYFHGGEMPGYNSFMGYDPVNDVTLIIWTSLTISLDGQPTANTIMLKISRRRSPSPNSAHWVPLSMILDTQIALTGGNRYAYLC